MFDVIIRNGDVIDGTGGPRRRADIGIVGERIDAVGDLDAEAATVIDATGRVVVPGFIDLHTHYDAQVFWDRGLTPSPLHGVTTAIGGNCGFSIAPLGAAADRTYIMEMLARVEGMPLEALREGVPWSWDSTADYLDAVDHGTAINIGFKVGHSALRRVVMGADATVREATPEEISRMGDLLRGGLEAGAIGFSSSWASTHNDGAGDPVPSRFATREELIELCGVLGPYEGTSLEFIPCIGRFEPWAMELMADMSRAAGRPLNWNVLHVFAEQAEQVEHQLTAAAVAAERGGRVVALTIPMSFPVRLSLISGVVLEALPGWKDAMALSTAEKLELLKDPDARRILGAAGQTPHPLSRHSEWAELVIFDTQAPENKAYRSRRVGDIASDEGREPFDVLCDIAVRDELRTSFGRAAHPDSRDDWALRAEVWRGGDAVLGASDAGAHLDMLASFDFAVRVLSHAVREHQVVALEEAVRLLTDVPARLYGLRDRGTLRPGAFADIVVLDPATVAPHEPTMRFDLPGPAGRLYASADGIDYVLVNGRTIVEQGAMTGATPGRVLRSGTDTAGTTVS